MFSTASTAYSLVSAVSTLQEWASSSQSSEAEKWLDPVATIVQLAILRFHPEKRLYVYKDEVFLGNLVQASLPGCTEDPSLFATPICHVAKWLDVGDEKHNRLLRLARVGIERLGRKYQSTPTKQAFLEDYLGKHLLDQHLLGEAPILQGLKILSDNHLVAQEGKKFWHSSKAPIDLIYAVFSSLDIAFTPSEKKLFRRIRLVEEEVFATKEEIFNRIRTVTTGQEDERPSENQLLACNPGFQDFGLSKESTTKGQWLDPALTLLNLAIISFYPEGTKLYIQGNSICPDPPTLQALRRAATCRNREALRLLKDPLSEVSQWIDLKSEKTSLVVMLAKKGLDLLIRSYSEVATTRAYLLSLKNLIDMPPPSREDSPPPEQSSLEKESHLFWSSEKNPFDLIHTVFQSLQETSLSQKTIRRRIQFIQDELDDAEKEVWGNHIQSIEGGRPKVLSWDSMEDLGLSEEDSDKSDSGSMRDRTEVSTDLPLGASFQEDLSDVLEQVSSPRASVSSGCSGEQRAMASFLSPRSQESQPRERSESEEDGSLARSLLHYSVTGLTENAE